MNNLFKRICSAIILCLIFFYALYSTNKIVFLSLITFLSLISLYELNNLLSLNKLQNLLFWVTTLVCYFLYFFYSYNFSFFIYISALFWIFVATYSIYKAKLIINNFEFLYGLLIIYGLFISTLYLYFNDKFLLLISFIIIWIADTSAYITGKVFGKRKLAITISPGKTFEGVYGSITINLLFIYLFSLFSNYSFVSLLILISILIPFSILGDLYESILKRNANVKDSGYLIPGHGGILDRLDGLCPTIPLIAIMSLWGFVL